MRRPGHSALEIEKLAPLMAALGERFTGLRSMGGGAQSSVWAIRGQKREYFLKVYRNPENVFPPAQEAALRRALLAVGGAVAEPVLTSADVEVPGLAANWMLDVFVSGRPLKRRPLQAEQAEALGQTLKALHALDLPEVADGVAGLPPYPNWARWLFEPQKKPSSVRFGPKGQRLQGIARLALDPPAPRVAFCHGDLHRDQVMLGRRGGVTLVDFGLARRCDPRWDLGALMAALDHETYTLVSRSYGDLAMDRLAVLPFAWAIMLGKMALQGQRNVTEARRLLVDTADEVEQIEI